ncbi:related to PFS2-polyadenylation factor I subunit 2 [Sporisorium reilianum SRZ2]|uniref:Polyadenylation factor subunit 2 n=1 Tax=Sporisorium reilianum (strain SRZ2) TaxID=999809 RepID=E6ZJW4_SPORE|nr:related to PFS2-polyadenylation factor I subunit 2 [Sporisorium reilianum SRZ2]
MAPVAVEPKPEPVPASPGSPSPKHAKHESPSSSPSPLTPTDPTASTSKRTLEEEEDLEAHALFPNAKHPPPYKKRVWTPTLHLTQPPQPPQPDPRTVQEMAAQQAATALGYEGRRIKKFMQRRTVDYFGALSHLKTRQVLSTTTRPDGLRGGVYPTPHAIPNFLLPAGYANLSTSVPKHLVHTSTNKIRCPVNVVKWMPDGRRLLTGSTSGEFTLWNGLTFNFETIMQAHDSAVRAMAWSKSGTYLISADQNGTVKYFQSNLNTLQAFTAHTDSARGLAFSPDDSKFASGGDDSLLKVWDFDTAKQIRELTGHGWDVKCLDWHASKGLLVSGSKDNLVKVWDPRATPTGTCLATFHNHKNTVQACKFSPDGLRFATASRDMTLKLYDLRMMAEQSTLRGHNKEVCSLDFHPLHHDLLVSGGSEGAMLFWDLSGATCEALSGANWGESRMVGGGGDGMDVGEGRRSGDEYVVHRNELAHESNVWSLEWHPFGHLLCSGSNDHMTRFWQRARPNDAAQSTAAFDTTAANASFLAPTADDSFIPGLGATKSFIPTSTNTIEPHAAGADDLAIPGLGFAGAPPQQHQQQYAGGAGGAAGGFTPGTGANAPLHGAAANSGWNTRSAPQAARPGGTYGAFY